MNPRYAMFQILKRYNNAMSYEASFFRDFLNDYKEMLSTSVDMDQGAAANNLKHSEKEPQVGEVWVTRSALNLRALNLPAKNIFASFLRIFVVAERKELHLGQYQELLLYPINDFIQLSTQQDLILFAEHTPFEEEVMLETWNGVSGLQEHLDYCLGSLSETAQEALTAICLHSEPKKLAAGIFTGGTLISEKGVHAEFQSLEKEQVAYLKAPLQALADLKNRLMGRALYIGSRRQSTENQLRAASTLTPAARGEEASTEKHTVEQTQIQLPYGELKIWKEGKLLEFYAHSAQQEPLEGVELSFIDVLGKPIKRSTDALGSGFVQVHEVITGDSLLHIEFAEHEPVPYLLRHL